MHPTSGWALCTPTHPMPLPFCRQNGQKDKQGERAGFVAVSYVPSIDVIVVLDCREF
ncbi:hypothetical protein I79_003661 [Cricetulus griseus]|uniref:Uncharacterized protein n=1 Tax=Cricetulus griseus TaxID=10029 RepID=G3H0K1_CRIGR|nr:hypothetical protein I79_003661 [Cricetulus griseus]